MANVTEVWNETGSMTDFAGSGLFDESEVFDAQKFQDDPTETRLKFLRGGYGRLIQAKAEHDEKLVSLDTTMQTVLKTLAKMETHLGKRPEQPEPSRHSSPVSYSSDPHHQDGEARNLPLENRSGLLRKIEMPVFDGSQPYEWLSKVERFFRVGRYNDYDKLDLVALSLEGDVLKWFNCELTRRDFQSWAQFKQRLFLRFGAPREEDPGNRLFAIKQTGSVAAYVSEFEDLTAQVLNLEDSHLEKIFYNGLKQEMKEVLKMKEPRGLDYQKAAVLRMESSSFCQLIGEKTTRVGQVNRYGGQRGDTPFQTVKPILIPQAQRQGQ